MIAKCNCSTNTQQVPVEDLTRIFDLTGPNLSNDKNESISEVKLPIIQTPLLQSCGGENEEKLTITVNIFYVQDVQGYSVRSGYIYIQFKV
jgi:hypothetical protein